MNTAMRLQKAGVLFVKGEIIGGRTAKMDWWLFANAYPLKK